MQAYALVQSEESRRDVMSYAPQIVKSALEAFPQKRSDRNKNEYNEKDERKCD